MTRTNPFSASSFGELKTSLTASGKSVHEAESWRLREDAEQYLDRLMGARRMKAAANVIWVSWPSLRQAACRLVEHIGPRYPGREAPLVDETIIAAVQAYSKHVNAANTEIAAAAFLSELPLAADKMLMHQVVAIGRGGKPVGWPHFDIAMSDWLDVVGAVYVYTESVPYLTPAERSGGRDFLAHRVMGHREYGLMKGASLRREGAVQ